MGSTKSGRRVAYDRVWGAVMVATAAIPASGGGWAFLVPGETAINGWLVSGTAMGALALVMAIAGVRSRSRHAINIAGGCALVATPLFLPHLWDRFPHLNPARLPLADLGRHGWVMLLALGAVYAGSGVRVARPTQFVGMALATPGALVAVIFACLPVAVGGSGYASSRILVFRDFVERWQELLPVVLGAAGVACAVFNMIRNRLEVALARLSRVLLVGALFTTMLVPFDPLRAWSAARFFAPLFLAIDGAIAFTAISITRRRSRPQAAGSLGKRKRADFRRP